MVSEENSFVLYKSVLCEVQAIAKTYPQTRAVSCQGNKVTKIAKVLLCNDVNVPGNFVVSITSPFLELCFFRSLFFCCDTLPVRLRLRTALKTGTCDPLIF